MEVQATQEKSVNEVQEKIMKESHQGLIGLVNIGNSCYMNSSLQALSNCSPFRQYFIECMPPHSNSNLSSALSLLLKKIWTSDRNPGSLNPRTISSSMRQRTFRGWQQQDAQEFLRCLFSQIHDELGITLPAYYNEYCRKSPVSSDQTQHTVDSQDSGGSSNGSLTELISNQSKLRSHSVSLQERTQSISKPRNSLSLPSSPSLKPKLSTKAYFNKGKILHSLSHENSEEIEYVQGTTGEHVLEDAVVIVNTTSGVASVDRSINEEVFHKTSEKENKCTNQVVSIVTEVFQGMLESCVKCLQCSKVSITQEPFQDLSLPIPGRKDLAKQRKEDENEDTSNTFSSRVCHVWNMVIGYTRDVITGPPTSLEDCLQAFFDSSDLSGENRYLCQHCKSFQNSKKETSIIFLPEVLCIHLKRFRYDAFFTNKISRHIQFPLTDLDMSPYMKYKDDVSCLYELFSVITHIGGAGGGHYISYAKGTDGIHWYQYNDSQVTEVSSDEVIRTEGYLLFYRKCSSQAVVPFNIADIVPVSGTHIPSPDVCYISRHWLLLRNYCHVPGPVVPYEFACEHGGILPGREQYAKSLAIPVRRSFYEQLLDQYGGGPLVSVLETCEECKSALVKLTERRKSERDKITQIQTSTNDQPETVLLSRFWLKQWQDFINCNSLEIQPPGPIDNSSLLLLPSSDSVLKLNTKQPYRSIAVPVWKYLHSIYGGGPLVATSKDNL